MLTPRSDVSALAAEYRRSSAVSIPGFLTEPSAIALTEELEAADGWLEIFRAGEKVYEMPRRDFLALPADRKNALRRMIENAARTGLQYRYRAIRVAEDPAERRSRGLALDAFADALNSPAALQMLREITGADGIALADAQATDYQAGDFLTTHDDDIAGKHRLAAYVYSLTSAWQADWGGLLLFERGKTVSGFVPDFNVLRIFAVPSRHHVSYVAPWTDARRLSVTGWLRGTGPASPGQTGS